MQPNFVSAVKCWRDLCTASFLSWRRVSQSLFSILKVYFSKILKYILKLLEKITWRHLVSDNVRNKIVWTSGLQVKMQCEDRSLKSAADVEVAFACAICGTREDVRCLFRDVAWTGPTTLSWDASYSRKSKLCYGNDIESEIEIPTLKENSLNLIF